MQQVAPKSQLWSWTQHNRHRTIWTGWNKEWSKMLNLNLCESWYWWIKDIKWYSLLLIADLYEYLGIFGFGREIMVVRDRRRNERNIWYESMRVVWIRWPCWRSQCSQDIQQEIFRLTGAPAYRQRLLHESDVLDPRRRLQAGVSSQRPWFGSIGGHLFL